MKLEIPLKFINWLITSQKPRIKIEIAKNFKNWLFLFIEYSLKYNKKLQYKNIEKESSITKFNNVISNK